MIVYTAMQPKPPATSGPHRAICIYNYDDLHSNERAHNTSHNCVCVCCTSAKLCVLIARCNKAVRVKHTAQLVFTGSGTRISRWHLRQAEKRERDSNCSIDRRGNCTKLTTNNNIIAVLVNLRRGPAPIFRQDSLVWLHRKISHVYFIISVAIISYSPLRQSSIFDARAAGPSTNGRIGPRIAVNWRNGSRAQPSHHLISCMAWSANECDAHLWLSGTPPHI